MHYSRPFAHRLSLLLLLNVFIHAHDLLAGSNKENPETAVQWQRWQHAITSSAQIDGPPPSVEVIFTGPKGKKFKTQAFTDNGKVYRFRAAFSASGAWSWETICSDNANASLHGQKGKVRVRKYKGSNPLYRHGDLKVSANGRYLEHIDGTPFLWIGETGWTATINSTMEEWREYVDKRSSQGFTVIQVCPRGVGKRSAQQERETISFREDKTIDPVFWQDFEDKVAYANDKGLFILIVGVGNEWRDLFARNPKNQKFETYLTGRLASHMVIFSPSFDQVYEPELEKVAVELQKCTNHLITQHSGTNYEANTKNRNSQAVDFCGLQSGHHGGNTVKAYNAARVWTLDMWNSRPVKPVINIETMYDGRGNNDSTNWREMDVRKTGWITWLSGSMGFTYGAGDVPPKVPKGSGGVWRFVKDPSAYDYWHKAVDWPSAGQITIMKNFFSSIEWWRLVPSHQRVLNQSEEETTKMTAAETEEKDLLLAYLPDNPKIVLNLNDYSGPMAIKWLNPVTGKTIAIPELLHPSANASFERPEGWDDALLILSRR